MHASAAGSKLFHNNQRSALLFAAALIAAIKIFEYTLDPDLLLDWDSGDYIRNGLATGYLSYRSSVYSGLIPLFGLPTHSLSPMVAVQNVMGGLTAFLLAYALIKFLAVRPWIGILAGVAFALDPVQLFHEHYILSETTTVLAMALFLAVALQYLSDCRLFTLMEASFMGIVLVSLRFVYLPLVLATAAIIPVVAWFPARKMRLHGKALAACLLVSLGATCVFHIGYRHLTGWIYDREPAYQYEAGFFLLGTVSPLIKATDIDDPRVAQAFKQTSERFPRDYLYRNSQLWEPDGLVWTIRRAYNDDRAANAAAENLARKVIRQHPLDFLKLSWETYCAFWRLYPGLPVLLQLDRTASVVGAHDASLISPVFSEYNTHYKNKNSLSRRYLTVAFRWYLFLMLSPYILAVALLAKPANLRGVALLFVWTCMLQFATCIGIQIVTTRYMHPFSFTSLIGAALLCESLLSGIRKPSLVSTAAAAPVCADKIGTYDKEVTAG